MSLTPIDIFIFAFIIIYSAIGRNNGCIKNIGTTINLIISCILSSLLINNLSDKYSFLNKSSDIYYLATFLIILIVLMILLGFIIEFISEQIDIKDLDKQTDTTVSLIFGFIKGVIMITLLIFIFDATPLSNDSRESIDNKLNDESLIFKPLSNLKKILFRN